MRSQQYIFFPRFRNSTLQTSFVFVTLRTFLFFTSSALLYSILSFPIINFCSSSIILDNLALFLSPNVYPTYRMCNKLCVKLYLLPLLAKSYPNPFLQITAMRRSRGRRGRPASSPVKGTPLSDPRSFWIRGWGGGRERVFVNPSLFYHYFLLFDRKLFNSCIFFTIGVIWLLSCILVSSMRDTKNMVRKLVEKNWVSVLVGWVLFSLDVCRWRDQWWWWWVGSLVINLNGIDFWWFWQFLLRQYFFKNTCSNIYVGEITLVFIFKATFREVAVLCFCCTELL